MKRFQQFKKEIYIASALILVLCLAIGGTWAYFTDRQTASNVFTVGGGVFIALIEPEWERNYPDGIASNIAPGQRIDKDPTVQAYGDDCWVRIKLSLKDFSNNQITGQKAQTIWSMIDGFSPEFILDEHFSDSEIGVRYYNYYEILTNESGWKTLFTSVYVPDTWSANETEALGSFKIVVTAQAVQAAGYEDDQDGAMEALHATAPLDNAISG